ncbi:hypothetical protein GW17_00054725, partial [Ensete ventricosum]
WRRRQDSLCLRLLCTRRRLRRKPREGKAAPFWGFLICSVAGMVSGSWRSSASPSSPKSGSSCRELLSLWRGRINRLRRGNLTGLSLKSPVPNESKEIRHHPCPSFVGQIERLDLWLGDSRKNQQKKVVCHVPAAGLSSDVWAWRKYGQKPIKGSPYPRCSSSKGCLARKQVERSRADSAVFIITYTAEHNHPAPTHRNSLAGSTRHKLPSPEGDHPPPVNLSSSPPASSTATGLSPTTPLTNSMAEELLRRPTMEGKDEDVDVDEEEGMLLVDDMEVMGEDDLLLVGGVADGSSPAVSGAASAAAAEAFLGVGSEL